MSVYQLSEYVEDTLPLSNSDARGLASRPLANLTITPSTNERGWVVKPSSTVGVVSAGDTQLIIRPKIGIRNVLALMDVGVSHERWLDDYFDFASDTDLLAATVHLFVRTLDRSLSQGLVRGYQGRDERLLSLRGRVDFPSLAHLPAVTAGIPCRFDDYTSDTELNRFLLAAIRQAMGIPRLSPRDRSSMHRHESQFQGVNRSLEPLKWSSTWTPTRLDSRFERSVRLGEVLLRDLTLSDHIGETRSATFLVDMNKLVESFLTARLTESLSGDLVVSPQHRTILDVERQVDMKPDLVLLRDNRPVFVADIKYKAVSSVRDVSNSDLYQAAAYATALNLPVAALITCGTGKDLPQVVTIRNSGVRVVIWPIDLSGDVEHLERAMQGIADAIRDAVRTPDSIPA